MAILLTIKVGKFLVENGNQRVIRKSLDCTTIVLTDSFEGVNYNATNEGKSIGQILLHEVCSNLCCSGMEKYM
jgi:hypothetical protein